MNPIVVLIAIAVIVIQIYLSKKEKRYLGLILPILTFIVSVIMCMYFVLSVPIGRQYTITMMNGESYSFSSFEEMEEFKSTLDTKDIVSEELATDDGENASFSTYFLPILRLGGGINVITLILLLIYWTNRHSRHLKQKESIQKKTVQALQ